MRVPKWQVNSFFHFFFHKRQVNSWLGSGKHNQTKHWSATSECDSQKKKVMDSDTKGTEKNWKHSLLYLTFIITIIHLTHQTNFSRKLIIGNETVRIKKTSDLPLRFRSDGTFKILQVCSSQFFTAWRINHDFQFLMFNFRFLVMYRLLICIMEMEW